MFKRKLQFLATSFLSALFFLLPIQAFSLSTGIIGHSGNPATSGGNTCTACHSGGNQPAAALTGPQTLEAGATATYVLSMSGGQENLGGFNISADNGILAISMPGTAVQNGELKHTQTFTAGTSGVEWTFTFQAPVIEGNVILYASVLSANNDGQMTGDNAISVTLNITITPAQQKLPPTASFDGPAFAQPGESIYFDASASADDGSVDRYLWDFGDGSEFGLGVNVSHVYDAEGNYTVTLAATDNDGLTSAVASVVTVSSSPGTAEGEALYNAHCFACHGAGGTGGSAIAITNASSSQISNALANITEMQSITLTPEEIDLIAAFLASGGGNPPPRPTDGPGLYGMFCAACHGTDGRGGSEIGVTGAPFPMIDAAINDIPAMQSIELSVEEMNLIAEFLTAGGGGTLPETGDGLYAVFCSVCHGSGGHGGKFLSVTGASQQMITEAIVNVEWMQALPLDSSQKLSIAAYLGSGGEPPLPIDDAGLYSVFCEVCHGTGGHGGKFKAVTGAADQMIVEAITNIDWMNTLQMTTTQRQQIAGYLGQGGEPPLPGDGEGLYGVFCAICHGDGGHGGKFFAVTGAPASMINSALNNEAWMMGLSLSQSQVNAIAGFLTNGGSGPAPSAGVDVYATYCAVCHGQDGRGGKYKVVTGSSRSFISSALNRVGLMQGLNLNSTQLTNVADFLSAGGGGTKPTTGSELYHVYCETCHGPNGQGGPEESVTGATHGDINSALSGVSEMRHLAPYLTTSGSGSDTALISNFLN